MPNPPTLGLPLMPRPSGAARRRLRGGMTLATLTPPARPRDLFGHPRGLAVLAGLEIWDRVSFYGMQALLVLYMVGYLLLPGHVEHIAGFSLLRGGLEGLLGPMSVQALATQIFGLYVGLVALTPILGGFLGDRWLGRRWGVTLGAVLMTAGHFAMAFDASFLAALLLLIFGAGFIRGNVVPQIGELYSLDDRRRGAAFQIYGAVINLGAFIAPLVTGALGQAYGWHVGFGFAGVGMLVGLVIYLAGQGDLPAAPPRGPRAVRAPPLAPAQWRMVFLLLAQAVVSALFWVAQSQVWNTYNLWVRDHLELRYGAWNMPVPWLQSLDGLAPFICLPPVLMLWRAQAARGREPDEPTKIAIGCFLFSAGTMLLAGAGWVTDGAGRTPLPVAVAFHLVSNLGWLFVVPTLIALYSRLAPPTVNATLLGVNAASVTLGSFVSGRLGGAYEHLSPAAFWALHAALVAAGGVLTLGMGVLLRREARAVPGPILAESEVGGR
jgi:POT family proton-dependent oligopeptide transporter